MVGFGVIAAFVVVLLVGILNPPRPAAVATDALGPDSGERVGGYLDRANRTLGGSVDDQHWALVSLHQELTPADVVRIADGVRVSEVLYRVPIDRVQSPVVTVAVSADPRSVLWSDRVAADQVRGQVSDGREAQVAAVVSARLTAGCPCVVAFLVRADNPALQRISQDAAVRAVEALPADAVFGRFSVRPLFPEQTDIAVPGPDDGPVPPA
ncbi:hypothetical protein FOS14_05775 [Skermania sp. ID1734]|nr:hypothetical protein FOS14_05775 [Skermania sp. ID1734]